MVSRALLSPAITNSCVNSYMALKMLPRTACGDQELKMSRYLKQHLRDSSIASMIDEFKIPHHRANEGYQGRILRVGVASDGS